MLIYVGTSISVLTVVLSSYYLLAKIIDIKRILAFAAIGFFSGTILLLGDRITTIRLPVLGEVVAKAREDATEISNMRKNVQVQSKAIKDVVKQAADLQHEIGKLTKELKLQKISIRKKILEEKINTVNYSILEHRRAIKEKYLRHGPPSTREERLDKRDADLAIRRLQKQLAQYSEDLDALEIDESNTKAD